MSVTIGYIGSLVSVTVGSPVSVTVGSLVSATVGSLVSANVGSQLVYTELRHSDLRHFVN